MNYNKSLIFLLCFLSAFTAIAQVNRVELPKGLYAFSMQEDAEGNVWVGLSDGNKGGSLVLVEKGSYRISSESFIAPQGSYHTSIKLPDGSLLFGGNIVNSNGFSILVWISSLGVDTIQIPFVLGNSLINCIEIINRREIWIGSASGLLVNNRGEWSRYSSRDGLFDNFIATIYQDFRDVVWIGTETGISYSIDGKINRLEKASRAISSATQFFGDNNGYVWAGSRFSSEGVSVFNGEVWETFSGRHGLVDNSASIVFQDSQTRLWVGSCYNRTRGGVSVFNGKIWNAYSAPQTLAKPCVDAIIEDTKGRIWLGGSLSSRREGGITILDGEKWIIAGRSKELPAERVITFFLDSAGNIWISSFEGLYIVEPSFNPLK